MREQTFYGGVLIASSVVLLAMGMTHPHGLPPTRDALEHVALINALAHSLAILGAWLALWGFVGLSRLLGLERPLVVAALVAFALPAAAITVAASLDGFVIPQLALHRLDADEATRATLGTLIGFCVLFASALTRVYMLLGALAIALWSRVIWQKGLSRGLPWLGVAVLLAGVATTFGGPAYISVHVLLLMVATQAAWTVWAGVLMMRRPS